MKNQPTSFAEPVPCRDAYTGVADNEAELYETVQPTEATVSNLDVGESNEMKNSIELELTDASDNSREEAAESEPFDARQRTMQQTLDATSPSGNRFRAAVVGDGRRG